jgi:DNA polymerase III epsilon subunit-like protein
VFEEEKRVNILINPDIPIPYDASQIHHIYDIDVKHEKKIEDTIDTIL